MPKIKKDKAGHFTIISNDVVKDKNLSFKARGLFLYLWSQKENWNYYEKEIVKHTPEGITSLRSGIKELENNGYLKRTREREGGKVKASVWVLSETGKFKKLDKPTLEKPKQEKPKQENRTLINTNLNKHQPKEALNKSSSSTKSDNPPKDPFTITADSKEEEDRKIAKIIDGFEWETTYHIASNQKRQINKLAHQVGLNNFYQTTNLILDKYYGMKAHYTSLRDPVAYLIKSLQNAR